ncbi:MAG: glutamate dehydrogenase, partial [Allosphingosinicella sp.]
MTSDTGAGASDNAAEPSAADVRIVDALAFALVDGALPGELAEFTDADRIAAARFIAACAVRRPPGIALVRVEPQGGALGHRRMRIGIVNDDMPFLVDSVANTLAARNLTVHRLLHPVLCVARDEAGTLTAVEPLRDEGERRESMMYLEVDRADARGRREIVADLHRVLADVRAAVTDWRTMQAQMRADADAAGNEEGAALLRWFAGGA